MKHKNISSFNVKHTQDSQNMLDSTNSDPDFINTSPGCTGTARNPSFSLYINTRGPGSRIMITIYQL
jgi:hypothetical protein